MSENVTEVAVGGAVLAVAAAFLFYALGTAGGMGGGSGYPLTASFRSAEGIGVGTDVRMAGVKVGAVTGMDLNAETFRAEATVQIENGIELPDDSAIVISSEGLLGGNFVEILPGGSAYNYEAGDEVLDTQGAVSLISLLMKFVGGGE
ncbi:outer membrane lipid asymmetry maintenance protein MlaD [Mangrovicoccus algicola]|uniref:Outer membrane lipid asymmetry maintenance protein MlaD n=1 Tax=Mangrovicoccus algicola TaxID=2771008 RepID=A0A8J7CKM4_9RHOB|nr:outer membrane lipid asymmetry maintenance protein MlaD [Mangrovicoccus algicola]MBE3639016.1 outer membrane lipid asymmetry maintenance protein MlaD [Mangrovicoccus algicola]